MVGRDVVADDVADRTPDELDAIARKIIAGALQLRHIAHLERDVVKASFLVADEVDGGVVRAAAQKREAVAHPVRDLEAQHVGVEARHRLHVRMTRGDVAEFLRHDALLGRVALGELIVGADFDLRALGVGEDNGFCDARRNVAAHLSCDAVLCQRGAHVAKIAARRDLKGDLQEVAGIALFNGDRLLAEFGGEECPVPFPLDDSEPDDPGPVVQYALEVRSRECGMPEPLDLNHDCFPDLVCERPRWSHIGCVSGMVHNSRKWTNSSTTATNFCAYLPIAAVWPNSRLSLSNMGNRGFFIDGRLCCLAVLCAVFCNAAQAQELACRFNVVGTGKVARILDGRSFALDDGREVRLAGIEGPPPAPDAADSPRNAP